MSFVRRRPARACVRARRPAGPSRPRVVGEWNVGVIEEDWEVMAKRRPDEEDTMVEESMDDADDEDDAIQPPVPGTGQVDYFAQFLAACQAGDPRIAEALVQQPGLARAILDAEKRWTGLHVAVKAGQLDTVRLLLEASCDVTACTHHVSTALHISACNPQAPRQSEYASHGSNPRTYVAELESVNSLTAI